MFTLSIKLDKKHEYQILLVILVIFLQSFFFKTDNIIHDAEIKKLSRDDRMFFTSSRYFKKG